MAQIGHTEPVWEAGGCQIADLPSWAAAHADALRGERRDAAENRQRVLASAHRLFAERGVDAVTMHDIAREAGVGQGTLYRRYPHKGALCQAMLEDGAVAFYQEATARLGEAANTGSALTQLESLLIHLLAFNEEHAPLLSAAARAPCGERRNEWYHSPIYTWVYATVVALLQRGAATGELRPLDTDCTADLLLALCDIDLYLFQRRERQFERERIVAGLRQVVGGLREVGVLPPPSAPLPGLAEVSLSTFA